ncbi:30S ribosomal protein S18 [candidate division WOR-1 bacterium RIFOXYB2_FULL_42_35]|uniref:Small ribosomal subunit protein bS18 n=1 Tax=candidate division WOR-1 bacterium RIFOXYC2_FULL_41_25 TaxID=1802586 RepID=A0A1F4TKJ5_UNCSA|nr:MAG: 30S ribosomal protein S18 [candidate division WOR-1 bacterium RIFOXYA2_FULL_41_14]OGC22449.1 MAG: 30S ribosomal protein S18 [candidate division WOR-1 bacterium RIFOXYB2_FULL_42_35]OGC33127.1 MAG: 30S ribosomal protein S18 [candidate division WOR-1 bacterium RIFOXYC2_FULL_41_25]OGC43054.1 MAG: 30S ribosomal protein S18 [candidate division WOR-1 bacterium RIFOXYD2_FULL_41_8]
MSRERRKPKAKPGVFRKRKIKPCVFCVEKQPLDYKNVGFLRRFMTDRGKIAPRRISGCCTLHQRMVAKIIKKARQLTLVPYLVD